MTSRERITAVLNHIEPDHVPVCDAPWASTVKRWRSEGLPAQADVSDFFGYEMKWFFPDNTPRFRNEIIEESDDFIVEVNGYGETIKNFKDRSTTPQILSSPVKSKNEWYAIRERLVIDDNRGISFTSNMTFHDTLPAAESLEILKIERNKGRYLTPVFTIGFDLVQRYLGMEQLLLLIADDPEWVKEMFLYNAKFLIEIFEFLTGCGMVFDGIFLADDLGYKNAPLFSPAHYRELLFPADKMICDYFHDQGLKVFLHCDGKVIDLIPHFIEAGIDCLQPLEVKAGMDLRELKNVFGDSIAFMGGIDTMLFSSDDPAILEKEIREKFAAAKKGGGYIYHCDHSIPDNVSFKQYQRVLELVHRYGKY